jgi:hypothetical protein
MRLRAFDAAADKGEAVRTDRASLLLLLNMEREI